MLEKSAELVNLKFFLKPKGVSRQPQKAAHQVIVVRFTWDIVFPLISWSYHVSNLKGVLVPVDLQQNSQPLQLFRDST